MLEIFDKDTQLEAYRNSHKRFLTSCIIRELKYPTRVQPKYYGVNPTEAQQDLIGSIEQNSFIVVNQSRKVGITTLMQGYTLWLTQLFEGKKVLYHNVTAIQSAQSLLNTMKLYSLMPNYSRVGIDSDNQMSVKFCNNSEIQCYNPGSNKHLKQRYDLIYIDNATFNKDLIKDLNTLHELLTPTGCLVCGSTLYKESPFRDMCYLAERDEEVPFVYKKVTHLQSKKRSRAYVGVLANGMSEQDMMINEYAAYYLDKDMKLRHLLDDLSEGVVYEGPKNITRQWNKKR